MSFSVIHGRRGVAVLLSLSLILLATGCGEDTGENDNTNNGETDYSELVPFDEANITSQLARLEDHANIVTLRKEATTENAAEIYDEIEAAYEGNGLDEKVAGRVDDHVEVDGWGHEDLGEFWDFHITGAIEQGKAGESDAEIAWAGQIIDKGLQVFFYYSVYHELYLKKRANFDEAHGYYGLDFMGEPREFGALANNAAAREDEFGLTINQPVFRAFIDARNALAEGTESNDDELGDNADYDEAWQTIDRKLMEILAYYAAHEIKVLTAENADIKLIEARVIWESVSQYAAEVDSERAEAIMDAMYPNGVPERDDINYFYVDLEDVRSGELEIDAQPLYDDMVAIAQTLSE